MAATFSSKKWCQLQLLEFVATQTGDPMNRPWPRTPEALPDPIFNDTAGGVSCQSDEGSDDLCFGTGGNSWFFFTRRTWCLFNFYEKLLERIAKFQTRQGTCSQICILKQTPFFSEKVQSKRVYKAQYSIWLVDKIQLHLRWQKAAAMKWFYIYVLSTG